MIKVKDKEATVSIPTRTITIKDVKIANGTFYDEEGNIADRVAEKLVNPEDTFKISIKLELPEEE